MKVQLGRAMGQKVSGDDKGANCMLPDVRGFKLVCGGGCTTQESY